MSLPDVIAESSLHTPLILVLLATAKRSYIITRVNNRVHISQQLNTCSLYTIKDDVESTCHWIVESAKYEYSYMTWTISLLNVWYEYVVLIFGR